MLRTTSILLMCGLAIALVACLVAPCAADDELQKLQVGEITITYPTGLEAQAKELAEAAKEVIPPRKQTFLKVRKALSDTDKVAQRITDLIRCPEDVDLARRMLSAFGAILDSVSGVFGDLRIYREGDVKASGGLQEGCWRVTYDAATDKFSYELGMESAVDERAAPKSAAFPVLVQSDGTFRTTDEASLQVFLQQVYDRFAQPVPTPVHEVTEAILRRRFNLHHPFARWFNEAAANWVMLKVASEVLPGTEKECRQACLPDPEDELLRGKVNLLAWEQVECSKQSRSEEERALSAASYKFATEALDRALRDQAPDTLAKIVGMLKSKPYADTEAICGAITEVTGTDFKSILLEYVPKHVREGLEQDQPKQLLAQAKDRMREKDYAGVVDLLTRVLEMAPCDTYARSNLALAMRETKMPKDESERQIKICAELGACGGELHLELTGSDDEAHYVFARIAQFGGEKSEARKHFESALKSNPDHEDAKAALKELGEDQ